MQVESFPQRLELDFMLGGMNGLKAAPFKKRLSRRL
jgi:hypothetical protein